MSTRWFLLAALAAPLACSAPPQGAPAEDDPAAPVQPVSGPPATSPASADAGTNAASESTAQPATEAVALLTVPSGIGCLVATVTGSTSETVSTSVAAGALTATMNFGVLNPGVITVNASAYAASCPDAGAPAGAPIYVGDPVQASVTAGVMTYINLVLHAATTASGNVIFSQPAIWIAAGMETTYAVLADGTVRAWGSNTNGELGGTLGATTSAATSTETLIPATVQGLSNVTQIAAGLDFACALRNDDSVVCWGDSGAHNFYGYGLSAAQPTVQPGLIAIALAAGVYGSAFVGGSGNIGVMAGGGTVSWLSNAPANQVGAPIGTTATGQCWISNYGDEALCGTPTTAAPGLTTVEATPVTQLQVGTEYASGGSTENPFGCALMANGTVTCWGYNDYGQLGLGSTSSTAVAPQVVPGLSGVVSLAVARSSVWMAHTCAATQSGAVYCSGANTTGQLGNATTTSSTTFVQVPGLTGVVQVVAGQDHTCARRGDGSVVCWGDNDYAQLGDGLTITRVAPVSVEPW